MLQRIENYNPYAYLNAPKVDGFNVVVNKPIHGTPSYDMRTSFSFEEIMAEFLWSASSYQNEQIRYEQAININKGMMYAEKYIDYGENPDRKLRDLREESRIADYSGMSDASIAQAIYNRYEEAFGVDFQKAFAYPSPNVGAVGSIFRQFNQELESVFGSIEKAQTAYRAARYDSMSDEEVTAAIAGKYPPTGKITLLEFYEFVWELGQVGLDDGVTRVLEKSKFSCGSDLAFMGLLDKPLDFQYLCNGYNSMRNAMAKTIFNDVGSAGAVLREHFGMSFDSLGNAYASRTSLNFSLLTKQFLQY